jgi:hypothetical protein
MTLVLNALKNGGAAIATLPLHLQIVVRQLASPCARTALLRIITSCGGCFKGIALDLMIAIIETAGPTAFIELLLLFNHQCCRVSYTPITSPSPTNPFVNAGFEDTYAHAAKSYKHFNFAVKYHQRLEDIRVWTTNLYLSLPLIGETTIWQRVSKRRREGKGALGFR